MLAFLNPGLPHSKSVYLNGKQTSGLAEFFYKQAIKLSYSGGHYLLTILILGALRSSLGNLQIKYHYYSIPLDSSKLLLFLAVPKLYDLLYIYQKLY